MKTYKIVKSVNWRLSEGVYNYANSHIEALKNISSLKTERIFNTRFREIEETGKFFFVEDVCKYGKTFVFEIIE